jgi:hypothetical protein
MTDWDRVARLRTAGQTWDEIAGDSKVGFHADGGTDPGRSLKVLYQRRRSNASGRSSKRSDGAEIRSGFTLRGLSGRRRALYGVAGGVAAIVVVAYLLLFVIIPGGGPNIVTYCGGEGAAAHYHVLLVINDNGAQQHLPYDPSQGADIGFIDSPGFTNSSLYCPTSSTSPGIHAIHTHDGSGIIHLEIPSGIPLSPAPTLGEFFQIWGAPLTATAVWTFTGHVSAQAQFEGGGKSADYSAHPATTPMPVPPGGPSSNPYTIPSSLTFNGNYGTGASAGHFDGEIIWLNVSGAVPAIPAPGAAGLGGNSAGVPAGVNHPNGNGVTWQLTTGVATGFQGLVGSPTDDQTATFGALRLPRSR